MKLSNQQVDALAVEICKKNNQKIEKEKSERLKNPEVIKKAKVAFAIFSKLDDIGKKAVSPYYAKKLSDFVAAYAEEIEIKTVYFRESDIKNKIILASIDSSSLDELKTKLNYEF